ncbi:MAG: sulfur carrier protein ThiS [Clostridiales bacterium]|jgi:sulfur carrier protein|nr:sulfur carrier protein ThiS [Clostridiales bacterium]
MKLTVSGASKEYPEGTTVAMLLAEERVEMPQYVTVAVNDEFLESGAFESAELKDGDAIEFMHFMGGGAHGFFQ